VVRPALPDSLRGASEKLRAFVEEAPLERSSIVEFVATQARTLSPGARVLGVGAGSSPYRELFERQSYTTTDHAATLHGGGVDIVAEAHSIPVSDDSFDAVLCTQVLEHVPDPLAVLSELSRVLVADGRLIATVPLVWEEHEQPYDFFRYTRYGIAHLLTAAGFEALEIRPRTDCFTTLAQLVRNAVWAMGSAPDGLDALRVEAQKALAEMSDALALLAPLDVSMILPLGYTVSANASRRLGPP
jgi:SAM-dependent methyltransferase